MNLTRKEKDALTQALNGMLNNWYDSWHFGHLDEEEEKVYQLWKDLREKLNS